MTDYSIRRTLNHGAILLKLRPVSILTAAAFAWSFLFVPLALAAQSPEHSSQSARIVRPAPKIYPPIKVAGAQRKPGPPLPLFPYRQVEAERVARALLAPKHAAPLPLLQASLLRGVESYNCPLSLVHPKAWKAEMEAKDTAPERLAQLHIWYGEWELATNEQPGKARWHYRVASELTAAKDDLHGLASYDDAMATFYEGAYRESARSFAALVNPRTAMSGYPVQDAAGWLRHADACAGYHNDRSKAGIPEPIRLDPYCGAAGLATELRSLGRPYDKATIAKACRITGQGSTLQDLVDAGPKLGLSVRALSADDKALVELPKPLIAHVEFDHFITVIDADKHGVSYLCSDCGPWPGGQVNLTWRQWHMLNPGAYASVQPRGSVWDKTIEFALTSPKGPIRVASVASSEPFVGLVNRDLLFITVHAPLLRGRIGKIWFPGFVACSGRPSSPHCLPFVGCPMQCAGQDPVNLATGEEEYTPAADINVYNPVGPSVAWKRVYNSARNGGNGYKEGVVDYQCCDYGPGWSQSYNIVISDPTNGGVGERVLIMANGSAVPFGITSTPSAGSPVYGSVASGTPMTIEWDYSSSSSGGSYKVTMPDRTVMIFAQDHSGAYFGTSVTTYLLTEIVDQNGNAITFNYGPPAGGVFTIPLLSSITNSAGTALLTILRAPDGTGNIWSIMDCYGRAVYYNVSDYTTNAPDRMLNHVSQVVPACEQNPPDRYYYGYCKLWPPIGSGEPYIYWALNAITVPSPTGSGSADTVITYDKVTDVVNYVVDPNGIKTKYLSVDRYGSELGQSNYAFVQQVDYSGHVVSQYQTSWDSNMSTTWVTNASLAGGTTKVYSDPNDPYEPSSVTDPLGHTHYYTWDHFNHALTSTEPSPRNTVTTYTYDYSHFVLGELTSIQEGTKQPTTMSYFEPSGRVQQINTPAPGTLGGTSTVTSSFTYDTLGNITSMTVPGNSTSSTIARTFGYTSDGSYSQPEALGQALTITDNLGKVTHARYDAQGNTASSTDALGNETDFAYDIFNNPLAVTQAATGETGPGRCYSTMSYLYPGGPMTSSSAYDESGNLVRTVNYGYGLNGEKLSTSGSTEPVSYQYDGAYRTTAIVDGSGHTTHYSYDLNGFLTHVSCPNASGSSYDQVSYPSYDYIGQPLERIDGRGIETDYTYNDPDNLLTAISYPASPSLNVSYTYDDYGRVFGVTDGAAATASTSGAGVVSRYDDGDRVTSVATTYIGQTAGTYLPTQTISYTFNPNGTTASMTTPAGTFDYTYDGDGRTSAVTNPFGETTTWGYTDNSWMQNRTMANGVTTTYTHNAAGLILDADTTTSSSTQLSNFSVPSVGGYDGVGNLLAKTDTISAATAYTGSTSYQYDTKNQLTQEASTRVSGYTNSYAFDGGSAGAGDPTTFKGASNTFNGDNQYTNTGYSYDGDGNPTTYKGATLTFDPEDRMTSYGSALTCGYLSFGMRAWKQNASGVRTYFLYAGSTPVCELDATGAVTATNTFGHNGLISRRVGSTSTFYTFDLQGGNAQRLDNSGNVIGSSVFNSYGTSTNTDGSTDPYSGYGAEHGYYTDSETGLELCTMRFYDPAEGRFINRDPASYDGGINVYNYTHNNATGFTDPSGLFCIDPEMIVGVLAVILILMIAPETFPFFLDAIGDAIGEGALDAGADVAADALDDAAGDGAEDALGNEGECDGPDGCFIAGTLVHMADGPIKPIEKVRPGDKVISRDPITRKTKSKTVVARTVHQVNDLVVLHFGDKLHGKEIDKITATPVHPFYIMGRGFVAAGQLEVGNSVVTRIGSPVVVVRIDRIHEAKPVPVYNFTIQDDHTYFVGSANGGEWVHNEPCNVTDRGLRHAMDRHYPWRDPRWDNKSVFNAGENLKDLINEATDVTGTVQSNGNTATIVNAGRNIGLDNATGMQSTPIYTVVTNSAGDLVTMHPGLPAWAVSSPLF